MGLNDIIFFEHSYTRRSSHGCSTKPTKVLFSGRNYYQPSNDYLDVTSITPPPACEYDPVKSLQHMRECEEFALDFIPTEHSSTDWEDRISRTGWSPDQTWLFQKVADILHADHLARLALKGSWSEAAKRRAHVDRTAQRFRNAMAAIAWDVRLTQWLHGVLITHLDISYLAAYLDILQTLKVRVPTLIERLLAGSVQGKNVTLQDGLNRLLKRPWDPALAVRNPTKFSKLPGNPFIVLIPSNLRKPQSTPRCNLWTTYLSSLATLLTVVPMAGTITARMTPQAYLEQMVSATKSRLSAIRAEQPDRPVILVGWRSGAAVALQAAATEPVVAVVCLGLSTRTVEGPRGDPDDSLYNLTTPVLFVTGEHATTARPEDLEEMRSQMVVSTGLVVVSSGDDCLRMSRRHRVAHGLTQSLVDRAVLEAVADFLADLLLLHSTPRPPSPIPPTAQTARKRRLSSDSAKDSEGSHKKSMIHPSLNLTRSSVSNIFSIVNGTSTANNNSTSNQPAAFHAPARRGRKPGSLNKTHRIPKTIKTLQTISPVKKSSQTGLSNDVTLNMGSLGGLGAVMQSGSSQTHAINPSSSSAVATFRIQAGRVSAASFPPADVMPPRAVDALSQSENVPKESSPPIMTLTPTTRTNMQMPARGGTPPAATATGRYSAAAPVLATTVSPSRISNSPVIPADRITIKSPKNFSPITKNIIRMTAARPAIVSSNTPSLTVRTPLKANSHRLIRSSSNFATPPSPVRLAAAPPNITRFALSKRLGPTAAHTASSSTAYQRPVLVKNRVIKSTDGTEKQDIYTLLKAHSSNHKDEKYYVQRAGERAETASDGPIFLVNRSSTDGGMAAASSSEMAQLKKHSTLVIKDKPTATATAPKHHLVSAVSASGQPILVQNHALHDGRPSSDEMVIQEKKASSTYILNYQNDQHEAFVYEVVDS